MQFTMFGHRCLVEHFRPKSSKSSIVIPDAAQREDTHRFGKVVAVGQGKDKNGAPIPALVKTGDVVMFQMNQVMENTQKYALRGRAYMNLLQTEIIGRLVDESGDITLENFEVIGDYVMLKHFFRMAENSKLVLPENLIKQSAPDFIYFKVLKKGSKADKPFAVGSEVIANLGRLTPLFFVNRDSKGNTENQEYCYTTNDWIDGLVEDNSGN